MDDVTNARRPVALHKIVPSLLTLMAMISGVTSIQMAIDQHYGTAIQMILIAAILDVLDGAVARALKAQSAFGAELDSLSDFLAFGVAPCILLYEWVLDEAGKLGWIATIVLPIAAALRLARFNVAARKPDADPRTASRTNPGAAIAAWKKRYFTGVPSPAGAGLALLPLYVWLMFQDSFRDFAVANWLIAVWEIVVAALMVSRIPTFSFKYVKLPARMLVPAMALIALILAALIHAPWVALTLISAAYLVSLPVVFYRYRKREKSYGVPEDLSSLAFGMAADDILLSDGPDERDDRDERDDDETVLL